MRLAGQDLFAIDEDARAALRAQHIGFVFQSFQLMSSLTALENVMLPLELAQRRDARPVARAMLERVGLGHYPKLLHGGERGAHGVVGIRVLGLQRQHALKAPRAPSALPRLKWAWASWGCRAMICAYTCAASWKLRWPAYTVVRVCK